MSYQETFHALNKTKNIFYPEKQPDLFSALDEHANIKQTTYWYVSDLYKILGNSVIPKTLIKGSEIFSHILTPHDFNEKKFPELDPSQKYDFREPHIEKIKHKYTTDYNEYKNATDYRASRYASASFIKKSLHTHDAAFAYAYFLYGTTNDEPNFEQICIIADEILRISSRGLVAKYEKQLSGILYNLKIKHSLFQNETMPYFFGGHTSRSLKEKHYLPIKKPLNDYLHYSVLDARAIALGNAIDCYNRNPHKDNEMLLGFVCQALRNARNELFIQTGRTPELSVTKTSVATAERNLKKLETEFVKKFSQQHTK